MDVIMGSWVFFRVMVNWRAWGGREVGFVWIRETLVLARDEGKEGMMMRLSPIRGPKKWSMRKKLHFCFLPFRFCKLRKTRDRLGDDS